MTSLPPSLLEQLLGELSTLASVYHKPPESFVGRGRFGADEIQRAAIQEQRDNAAENPIAAAAAAAGSGAGAGASGGGAAASPNNIENLLDIDFDGAAPASSSDRQQQGGSSSTATPDRVASPGAGGSGGMADMMGLFDAPAASAPGGAAGAGGANDIMNGFAGLDLGGSSQPPPASVQLGHSPQQPQQQQQQQPKSGGAGGANEDLLGLF